MKEDASNFNSEVFWEREYERLYLYALFRVKEDNLVDQVLSVLKAKLNQSAERLAKLDLIAQRAFAFKCIDQFVK